MTQIKAKKDLYNHGKCFTKGNVYTVEKHVHNQASLINCSTINDLGEPHNIGSWWREFTIINQ